MAALRQIISRHPLVTFFLLAFVFTWSYWLPQALTARGIVQLAVPEAFMLLAGYGPALAAIIVTAVTTGRAGLRRLFSRLTHWRVGLGWYLFALLTPFLMTLAALGLFWLTSGSAPQMVSSPLQLAGPDAPLWQQVLLLFAIFTLGFDGLGEELGWRGYALPKLQARYSALSSSLILGLCWAAWHLAYAFTPGTFLATTPLVWFFLSVLGSAILHTWIFNNTQGSVLLTILFHAAGNVATNLLVTSNGTIYQFSVIVTWCLALLIVVVTGGRSVVRPPRLASELMVEPATNA